MAVIVIEEWMVGDLKLKGDKLLAFAVIYSCTQKGNGCWYGGYDKLADIIGATQRGIIKTVKALMDDNLIERGDAMIDGKPRKVLRSVFYSERSSDEQNSDERSSDERSSDKNAPNTPNCSERSSDNSNINNNTKNNIYSPEVEQLYKRYPNFCPKRNAETGKRPKQKVTIARLLTHRSFEDLMRNMELYLEKNYGKNYIQNFSTFLNNYPDYSEIEEGTLDFSGAKQEEASVQTITNADGSKEIKSNGFTIAL